VWELADKITSYWCFLLSVMRYVLQPMGYLLLSPPKVRVMADDPLVMVLDF